MKTQERTYQGCVAGTEGCSYVRLDYPVLVDVPEGAGALAETVSATIGDFVRAPTTEQTGDEPAGNVLDAFLAEFEQAEPGAEETWFLERKAFVLLNTESLLSLSLSERAHRGGEQPRETFRLQSFDAGTGERLELDDVIAAGKRSELRALAESEFREVRALPPEESLEEAGFTFENGAFTLTENFAIQEDGIVFYYEAGQVAPEALGPTEIELAWNELDGLVAERFTPRAS